VKPSNNKKKGERRRTRRKKTGYISKKEAKKGGSGQKTLGAARKTKEKEGLAQGGGEGCSSGAT